MAIPNRDPMKPFLDSPFQGEPEAERAKQAEWSTNHLESPYLRDGITTPEIPWHPLRSTEASEASEASEVRDHGERAEGEGEGEGEGGGEAEVGEAEVGEDTSNEALEEAVEQLLPWLEARDDADARSGATEAGETGDASEANDELGLWNLSRHQARSTDELPEAPQAATENDEWQLEPHAERDQRNDERDQRSGEHDERGDHDEQCEAEDPSWPSAMELGDSDPEALEPSSITDHEGQAPARYRIVFYDRERLRYLDGWTRAAPPSSVYLIDRGIYDDLRRDAVKRGQEFNRFLRQALTLRGQGRPVDLMAPSFMMDPATATAPLRRRGAAEWDDLMIAKLVMAAKPLTIASEATQWQFVERLFDKAKQDARAARPADRQALEFVAYFALDTIKATLGMFEATNVRMIGNHAEIPIGRVRGTDRLVVPGGDAEQRVIGDIHTHYLLDPFIDTNRTGVGTTISSHRQVLHAGVSDVDVGSARTHRMVVYAVDSRHLHRADPDGSKHDKLPRSGDILRQALRVFGGEPA
jgi:hypothetical protein